MPLERVLCRLSPAPCLAPHLASCLLSFVSVFLKGSNFTIPRMSGLPRPRDSSAKNSALRAYEGRRSFLRRAPLALTLSGSSPSSTRVAAADMAHDARRCALLPTPLRLRPLMLLATFLLPLVAPLVRPALTQNSSAAGGSATSTAMLPLHRLWHLPHYCALLAGAVFVAAVPEPSTPRPALTPCRCDRPFLSADLCVCCACHATGRNCWIRPTEGSLR